MKKQEKQKNRRKQKNTRASYIGAAAVAGMGVMGIVLTMRMVSVLPGVVEREQLVIPTMPPVPVATVAPVSKQVSFPEHSNAPASEDVVEEETETVAVISRNVAAEEKPIGFQFPVKGKIVKPFSADRVLYSKSMGEWQVHTGVDIEAPRGTEVLAAAKGTIERTDLDALMGYTVVIQHDEQLRTVYQNLASVDMVQPGQVVEAGVCIGAVGDSAAKEMLEEHHLHFEVIKDGVRVNPSEYIKMDE